MPATGAEHWTILFPELALVAGAIVLLMLDVIKPGRRGAHLAVVTLLSLAASLGKDIQSRIEPRGACPAPLRCFTL